MIYPNPQIYHHLKTIFVHVPKAAGTSIERQLREHPTDIVGGHTTALGFRRKYPMEFGSYYKFAVVREPFDRFLSAYCYLREQQVHAAHDNKIIHELDTLDRFVSAAQGNPPIFSKMVHLLAQHPFVCDREGKILVDAIYRFEELPEAWEEICERSGLAYRPLAKLNPSRREGAGGYDEKNVRAFVARTYAKDFETFGYPTLG